MPKKKNVDSNFVLIVSVDFKVKSLYISSFTRKLINQSPCLGHILWRLLDLILSQLDTIMVLLVTLDHIVPYWETLLDPP